jgi:hypothetical protein
MNYTTTRLLVIAISLTLVAGCGARRAEPVEKVRATDNLLTCDHLAAEKNVNLVRARDLLKEKNAQEGNNIGMLLFNPLFLDLSGTEKKEIEALHARNQKLDLLMLQKKCPLPETG